MLTLASIGATACAAADMVHEALGHGTASWLTGNRILLLSTVGLQSAAPSRFVCAAGTTANCIAGAISLLLLLRIRTFTPLAYFVWIFGAYNLLNSGYLILSAVANGSDDWTKVMAGLSPPWLWRCALGIVGTTLYVLTIHWVVSFAIDWVNHGEVALADLWRLVLPAYLAGGAAMTTAAIFNPYSPSLILAGVSASFGLHFGLLFLPRIVAANAGSHMHFTRSVPFSLFWLALGLVASGLFIGILGPGIHFSN